jgi:cellulose synthase/poly-beta-1,6-N-acetylglucosamine synthase-like glycosyltransferase
MRRHANIARGQRRWKVLGSPLAPTISVLAPVRNEAATIGERIQALLTLQYPNHEVVVIDDGSTDATLDALREHFQLVPVHPIYQRRIVTRTVHALYRSAVYPHLVVIEKAQGSNADALNAGLNVATGSLVCSADANTLLEADALQRLVRPFLEQDDVLAAGGTVRVANACEVRSGRVAEARVPGRPLPGFQAVEYLRVFVFGRLGWNRLGGNLLMSGAFGLFRRDAILAVGGWADDAAGEDLELVLRLRRRGYEQRERHRIAFVPDPIAWMRAPTTVGVLGRQREGWHRGLGDALWRHRRVFLNPKYGAMGMIVYPYFLLMELLAPLVELIGVLGLAIGLATGVLSPAFALMFLLFVYGLGTLSTVITLAMDELNFQRFTHTRDRVLLVLWALIENLGYRQVTVFWRLKGFEWSLREHRDWNAKQRRSGSRPALRRRDSHRAA